MDDLQASEPDAADRVSWLRVGLAGALMGWANLVPGVSGGTMLLVCGVYPNFVSAIADLTRLRLRRQTLLWIGTLTAGAAIAVLSAAGVIKSWVETQPVAMYSLFAGLTLGGVPLVVRRAAPLTPAVWISAGVAFAAMVVLALLERGEEASTGAVWSFVAGLAGASAMVLPGLSGSYLLLLMGQYVPVLGAIESFRNAALGPLSRGASPDVAAALEAAGILLPFACGVALGIVLVAHGIRAALRWAPGPTYGVLLGLLLGAVPGLWPFSGWPPAPSALTACAALVAGFGATQLLSRLDPEAPPASTK